MGAPAQLSLMVESCHLVYHLVVLGELGELLGEGGGEPLGEQHFGELLGSCRWDYRARDRGSGGSERRR